MKNIRVGNLYKITKDVTATIMRSENEIEITWVKKDVLVVPLNISTEFKKSNLIKIEVLQVNKEGIYTISDVEKNLPQYFQEVC